MLSLHQKLVWETFPQTVKREFVISLAVVTVALGAATASIALGGPVAAGGSVGRATIAIVVVGLVSRQYKMASTKERK